MNTKLAPRAFAALCCALLLACPAPALSRDASCEFRGAGVTLTFGNLDPSNPVQVVRMLQGAGEVGDCNSKGLNLTVSIVGPSARQLTNGSGGVIPYTLSGFPVTMPQPGNNAYPSFLAGLTGTIASGVYVDAPAGAYSDNVTIRVDP